MSEKHKYLNIYSGEHSKLYETHDTRGKIGGGYGRICWGEGMLELMKDWKVGSLLDVGCGYGNFCDAATLFATRVYGLDIASVATGNVVDNPDITFFDGEANTLPLPDNSVEWVTSFDCLEHCLEKDIDQILAEFDRVSVKGFALSISYEPCDFEGVELHMTVKPESWWMEKFSRFGKVTKEGQVPITNVPYLVCRKPVTPKVFCYCTGGLGMRLQSLAACDGLATRTGRSLSVVWPEDDPLCPVSFSELFTNTIDIISDNELLDLPSCKIYADIKDVANQTLISGNKTLRSIVRRWGSTETNAVVWDDNEDNIIVFLGSHKGESGIEISRHFLQHLEPVDPIRERINAFGDRLGISKDVMGVHARGTDFGISVKTYGHHMIKAIEQNQSIRFLVCSDDEIFEKQLKNVFKEKVIIRPKTDWVQKIEPQKGWALGNMRISKSALSEALVDLYLLGRTDFRIYNESSAVARLCKILSNGHPSSGDIKDTLPSRSDLDHDAGPSLPTVTSPQQAGENSITSSGPTATLMANRDDNHSIYFFCPDTHMSSAGIRRLYRHVTLLNEAGFRAYMVHEENGFKRQDMPDVPLKYVHQIGPEKDAVLVIPEGMPAMMHHFKDHPGRRFVIALNWHYIFGGLPDHMDWRHLNIERVLVVSPVIGQMVSWSMNLPVHLLNSSIDHRRYDYDPASKRPQITFIQRKAVNIDRLKRLVGARNPDYVNNIKWVGLDGLPEDDYANQICASSVFLNTSMSEGLPTSSLEAMAAGTIVAGYDSVGGRNVFTGSGPLQDCILAPNGDYVSLAYALEPVLTDLAQGRMQNWRPMITNARNTASKMTLKSEKASLIAFWQEACSTT